ncbi:MAG: type sorting protein [Bacteroidota bacterium]|nr:type sorting protein [Bacteroidota bacterium]
MIRKYTFLLPVFLFFIIYIAFGEDFENFGISILDNPSPGYILTGPTKPGNVTIYDNSGEAAYFRDLKHIGEEFVALRILENGNFACFSSGTKEWLIFDESLNIIDRVSAPAPYSTDFHTLHISPQGNYLLVGDIDIRVNMQEKVTNGFPNAYIFNMVIMELDYNKNVVFEWDCSEHIDILDATEDINLTDRVIDPYHINHACYDNDGNLLANFRNLDETIKINRNTGEIIWIMGGSKSRRNQFTFINDTRDGFYGFSHQHDPKRLDNGNILFFDNGNLKPVHYSRAVEYRIDESAKTATKVWEFRNTPDISAAFMGNAQRLPNGNTIIGWGVNSHNPYQIAGIEVTPAGEKVFEMRQPIYGALYQVLRNVYKMNSVSLSVNSNDFYDFNNATNRTGVGLNIISITGQGLTSVEKHEYAPHNISFDGAQACIYVPNRWVINNRGINSINSTLFIDLGSFNNLQQKEDLKIFYRHKENTGSFRLLPTTYNQIYNRLEANITGFGEFMVGYTNMFAPNLTSPLNGVQQVSTSPTLKWSEVSTGDKSHLQISLYQDFHELVADVDNIAIDEYKPNNLKNLTRYYWRVKVIKGDCESSWSNVFSFVTIIGTPVHLSPSHQSTQEPLSGEIKWYAIKGAEDHKLQISEDLSFYKPIIDIKIKGDTTYKYSNLKPLTKYFRRINAVNQGLSGNWSDIWHFTTTVGKVNLKSPVSLSEGNPTDGILKWDTINSIKYYRLQLSSDPYFNTFILDTTFITKNEFHYSGLKNSTLYYWRVRGYFRDTATNWSDRWQFRTITGKPELYFPKDSSVNVMVKGGLNWSFVMQGANYQFQVSMTYDFAKPIIDQITYFTFFSYSYLSFNTRYYWRVRANDGKSYSDWSNIRTFTTSRELVYPGNDDYKIPLNTKLIWHQTYGTDKYYLRIADDSLFTVYIKEYTISSKDTSYNVNDLGNNKTYFWGIKAKKSFGESNWSETFKFTTQLEQPVLIYPLDNSFKTSKTIKFKWQPSEHAAKYHLVVASDSLFLHKGLDKSDIVANEYESSELSADNTYFWQVSAANDLNSSDWASTKKFIKHDFIPLISPKGGETWAIDSLGKPIEWDIKITDTVRIDLLRDGIVEATIENSIFSPSNTYLWHISGNISQDSSYQIMISSISNPDLFSISTDYFTITNYTGIQNPFYSNTDFSTPDIKNYPNPVNGTSYFDYTIQDTGIVTLKVYSIEGVVIAEILNKYQQPGVYKLKWDTSELPSGVYYYILSSGNSNVTGRITIIR